MTDKELLELAGKAAGVDLSGATFDGWGYVIQSEWNPLTDDGDALRLAVRLELNVAFNTWTSGDAVVIVESQVEYLEEDPFATTRRAIVRAAAEIGKNANP